jgi:SAM-dependent methyltransferase
MTLERVDISDCADRLQVVLHSARYQFILSRLPPGARVLEIGVGSATFTKELFPRCGSYVGVEYDSATCAEARRKTGGTVEIIEADARALPFADNEFSFIVCLEVLEHLGDFRAGVRNIHRCLRPGGLAIVSVPYRRIGGKSETNEHHPYEPGEGELVSMFQALFARVEVQYQYFEETGLMTVARTLHLRRLLGLHRPYADLSAGVPEATSRLQIGPHAVGMKMGLIIVGSDKR